MISFSLETRPDRRVPLAVVVFQGDKGAVLGKRAGGLSAETLRLAGEDGFRGKKGEALFVRAGAASERFLLLSAGRKSEADLQTLRMLAGTAARKASDAGIKTLSFLLPEELASAAEEAQAVAEGVLLGSYRFEKHKSRPSPASSLSSLSLIASSASEALREAVRRGRSFGGAVSFARDLINEPPSRKVPETLGAAARSLAGAGVSVRVYKKSEIARMRMEALLGVNRGSAHPPVLVHLRYKPSGKPRKRLAFVGKGITFDSGGLSLKPADGMMTMKYDMAGAATVFGLFRAMAELRPDVEVHGVAPVTENMPGHDAYKPGDVVRARNGKTIEVLNTDAEGRVVLADALSFASELPVDEIVDVATLTGAVTVALGKAYAAVMTDDEGMMGRLKAAAERAGEKVWRLPLEPSYKEHIKSKVADLKNIGNPGEAGTIVGGLFLQEFTGGKRWAHVDMAGVGWNGNGDALGVPGATGAMVRTFLQYILA